MNVMVMYAPFEAIIRVVSVRINIRLSKVKINDGQN